MKLKVGGLKMNNGVHEIRKQKIKETLKIVAVALVASLVMVACMLKLMLTLLNKLPENVRGVAVIATFVTMAVIIFTKELVTHTRSGNLNLHDSVKNLTKIFNGVAFKIAVSIGAATGILWFIVFKLATGMIPLMKLFLSSAMMAAVSFIVSLAMIYLCRNAQKEWSKFCTETEKEAGKLSVDD